MYATTKRLHKSHKSNKQSLGNKTQTIILALLSICTIILVCLFISQFVWKESYQASRTSIIQRSETSTITFESNKITKRVFKSSEPILPEELIAVAWCESRYRQYNEDGMVLKNPVTSDYGYFQINTYFWGDKADELGYNIMEEEGNIKMAIWLYNRYGLEKWRSSERCWSKLLD